VQRLERRGDAGLVEARRIDGLVVVRLEIGDHQTLEAGGGCGATGARGAPQGVAGHERGDHGQHDEEQGEDGKERSHERPW
jgi:hypothetical protein